MNRLITGGMVSAATLRAAPPTSFQLVAVGIDAGGRIEG